MLLAARGNSGAVLRMAFPDIFDPNQQLPDPRNQNNAPLQPLDSRHPASLTNIHTAHNVARNDARNQAGNGANLIPDMSPMDQQSIADATPATDDEISRCQKFTANRATD